MGVVWSTEETNEPPMKPTPNSSNPVTSTQNTNGRRHNVPFNEGCHVLNQVRMITRHDIRTYFDSVFYDHWGYFIDNDMSTIIHAFMDWVAYPDGDHVLTGHTDWVNTSVVSDNGHLLYTGSDDGSIIVWDLTNYTRIDHSTMHHDGPVRCLAYRRGYLVSASLTNVHVWKVNHTDHTIIHHLEGHTRQVTCVSVNQQSTLVASGSLDGSIRVWSMLDGQCIFQIYPELSHWISSVLFHMHDDVIITCCYDRSLKVLDFNNGKEQPMDEIGLNQREIVFGMDVNNGNDTPLVYQWPKVNIMRGTNEVEIYYGEFHPFNHDILAIGNESDYSIWIINVRTEQCVDTLIGHTGLVTSVCFVPDGHRLISTSEDETVRVWDVSHL